MPHIAVDSQKHETLASVESIENARSRARQSWWWGRPIGRTSRRRAGRAGCGAAQPCRRCAAHPRRCGIDRACPPDAEGAGAALPALSSVGVTNC